MKWEKNIYKIFKRLYLMMIKSFVSKIMLKILLNNLEKKLNSYMKILEI